MPSSRYSPSDIETLFLTAIRAIDTKTDAKSLALALSRELSSAQSFDFVRVSIKRRNLEERSFTALSKGFPCGTPSQRSFLQGVVRKIQNRPIILSKDSPKLSEFPLVADYLDKENLAWIGIFPFFSMADPVEKIGSITLLRKHPVVGEEAFVARVEKGLFGLASSISARESENRYGNLMNFYSALHEINHLIARHPSPDSLYHDVCRIAVLYGSLDLAWIALIDKESGEVRIKNAFGPAKQYIDSLPLSTDPAKPLGNGPAGKSLREGRVIITEIDTDPDFAPWRGRAFQFNLHSSASFPFKRSGNTEGLMGVYSRDPRYFSPPVIALLSRLAEDMEFSLSTYDLSRHIEKLQRNLRSLLKITEEIAQRPDPGALFQRIVGMIVDHIGGAFAAIVEVRPEGRILLSAYAGALLNMGEALPESVDMGKPEGFGIVARTIRLARPLVVDNFSTDPSFLPWRKKLKEQSIVSGAGFPLKVDSEVVGVLVIGSSETGFFSEDIADLFENMAENISFAIKDSKRKKQLEYLSLFDELTTLPNRASFRESLNRSFNVARMNSDVFAVGIIDIDNFKEINDSLGHLAGDQILREIGARFRSIVSSEHILARIGGDEFGVILRNKVASPDLLDYWTALSETLKEPVRVSGSEEGSFFVTTSMGFSIFSGEIQSPDDLLKQADQALYSAKDSGRNTWGIYTPELDERIDRTVRIRRQFKYGLDHHQMCFYVQPQVDLNSGRHIGSEALLRWIDPASGDVRLPGAFLPVIEKDTTLVTILGQWVLEEAYTLLGQPGMEKDCLSINIGALHFLHSDFLSHVDTFHRKYPEISRRITIEITEAVALSHLGLSARKIRELSSRGITVSLDDFGTGFGSLSYLSNLPVNEIKIDQSFIRNMATRSSDFAIVSGTMLTAAIRKIRVVAEGLESLSTGVDLLRIGCHYAQGYGIARPMPASELPAWKQNWTPPDLWKKAIHSHFLYRGIDLLAAQVEVRAMEETLRRGLDSDEKIRMLKQSWTNLLDWIRRGARQFEKYESFKRMSEKAKELDTLVPDLSFRMLDRLLEIEDDIASLINAVEEEL
jgi:diguanylate cyclase (GGDEF)-like protein